MPVRVGSWVSSFEDFRLPEFDQATRCRRFQGHPNCVVRGNVARMDLVSPRLARNAAKIEVLSLRPAKNAARMDFVSPGPARNATRMDFVSPGPVRIAAQIEVLSLRPARNAARLTLYFRDLRGWN
ncbi:unnamed protein product [Prunus brigantina]